MDTAHCRHCRGRMPALAPRVGWSALNVVMWTATLVTGMAFGLLIGLDVLLVPLWLGMAGAVSYTAQRAASWRCAYCKEEIAAPIVTVPDRPARVPATSPHFGLVHRHA